MQIKLNPSIDVKRYAEIYAAESCVQIPNVIERDSADWIENILRNTPWRLVLQDENLENLVLTREQITAMPRDQIARLNEGMRERAAKNLGFTYLTYPMIQARLQDLDSGHPIHAVTDFLNTPEFLELARAIIRNPGVTKVDAHATNYQAGSFLTRHHDEGMMKERRAAYTLGFTRKWEPDWGGLLTFIDDDMDVSRALIPRFNVLTVFDGMKLHSVSQVSMFAPAPRLSVTGWFRDDPLPGGA